MRRHGGIAAIGTVDGAEDEGAIFDRPAHGSDFVHAPAQGHCAVATDAAEGRTQAGDAAAIGGRDDGAHGFGADSECDQAGRHRRA